MAFQQKSISTGGEAVFGELQDLFTNCWEKGTLPQDLRDAVIVSLYKNKGEKSDSSNCHGITLLSIAGRILAGILLKSYPDNSTGKHARNPVSV